MLHIKFPSNAPCLQHGSEQGPSVLPRPGPGPRHGPEVEQELVCAFGGRQKICIPENYQKYDLPTTKG